MRRFGFRSIIGFALGFALGLVRFGAVELALAATIVVAPGPGTPIQDALDAAAPGDTVRLTAGDFFESGLVIAKPLTLRGEGSGDRPGPTTIIRTSCVPGAPVIDVVADSVTIRGFAIDGSRSGGIRVHGRQRVKLQDVFIGANCASITEPQVDVEASTKVLMSRVWASGNQAAGSPLGIRIAATPPRGGIKVKTSIVGHHDVGVLLDGNADRSVNLGSSWINFNDRGIVVRDTVGATIGRCREIGYNGANGVLVEGTSSGNKIIANRIEGSVLDVADTSTGPNCWKGNTFVTGVDPGCP